MYFENVVVSVVRLSVQTFYVGREYHIGMISRKLHHCCTYVTEGVECKNMLGG